MEKKNEVILSTLLFYDLSEFKFNPNKMEDNSPFSNQKNYGYSIQNNDNALLKKKSDWFNNQAFTQKKFKELVKTNPTKLIELFSDLQKELEIYQLQEPSLSFENFKILNKFYVEIIKQVRDNIFKSESTSGKSKLWKYFYQFSDLEAPYPKTLKLKTKSGEVKETEFPNNYFMMKTENFYNKSQEKWIKKPLILLNQTEIQLKNLKIEKSWKLNTEECDLEVETKWKEFKVEREKFEKTENYFLGSYFLIKLLTAFTTSDNSNRNSIKVVKVWDIVYDSVLSTWVLFMQKEYFQKLKKQEALEKAKMEDSQKQIVINFASYKKNRVVTNLSEEFKNQADLLCQDEMYYQGETDYQDFTTYLDLSIAEVASLKKEKIEKFGKLAALRERLYFVCEPLLTALIRLNLLILESREERNNKNFEQDEFLTLEEVKNLKSNTLRLNLDVNELNQSFFK